MDPAIVSVLPDCPLKVADASNETVFTVNVKSLSVTVTFSENCTPFKTRVLELSLVLTGTSTSRFLMTTSSALIFKVSSVPVVTAWLIANPLPSITNPFRPAVPFITRFFESGKVMSWVNSK